MIKILSYQNLIIKIYISLTINIKYNALKSRSYLQQKIFLIIIYLRAIKKILIFSLLAKINSAKSIITWKEKEDLNKCQLYFIDKFHKKKPTEIHKKDHQNKWDSILLEKFKWTTYKRKNNLIDSVKEINQNKNSNNIIGYINNHIAYQKDLLNLFVNWKIKLDIKIKSIRNTKNVIIFYQK